MQAGYKKVPSNLRELLYLAKFDLRNLSTGGARYTNTELEYKVRQARKKLKQLGIAF